MSMLSTDVIISANMWQFFSKITILLSAEHSDEHLKHLRLSFTFFSGSSSAMISTRARLSVTFGNYIVWIIRILLLCDWSVQQTATKPQTQWKGMFGCEQPFLWGSIVCHPKKGYRGNYVRLSHIIRSAYAAGLNEDTTWLSLLSSVCEAKMHCKTNYTMVSIWLYETNPNTLML